MPVKETGACTTHPGQAPARSLAEIGVTTRTACDPRCAGLFDQVHGGVGVCVGDLLEPALAAPLHLVRLHGLRAVPVEGIFGLRHVVIRYGDGDERPILCTLASRQPDVPALEALQQQALARVAPCLQRVERCNNNLASVCHMFPPLPERINISGRTVKTRLWQRPMGTGGRGRKRAWSVGVCRVSTGSLPPLLC